MRETRLEKIAALVIGADESGSDKRGRYLKLAETFGLACPRIVAFATKGGFAPAGKPPLMPKIFGTGFFVDVEGIVATNRHAVRGLEGAPRHSNIVGSP